MFLAKTVVFCYSLSSPLLSVSAFTAVKAPSEMKVVSWNRWAMSCHTFARLPAVRGRLDGCAQPCRRRSGKRPRIRDEDGGTWKRVVNLQSWLAMFGQILPSSAACGLTNSIYAYREYAEWTEYPNLQWWSRIAGSLMSLTHTHYGRGKPARRHPTAHVTGFTLAFQPGLRDTAGEDRVWFVRGLADSFG